MSLFYAIWEFVYCFAELFVTWRLLSAIFLLPHRVREDWKAFLWFVPLGIIQGVNAQGVMMSIAILYINIAYMTVLYVKKAETDKKNALLIVATVCSSFYLFRLATIHLLSLLLELPDLADYLYQHQSLQRFFISSFHMMCLTVLSLMLVRHFEEVPFDMECWRWTLLLVSITENLAIIYFQGIFTNYGQKDILQDVLLLSLVLHILATIVLAKYQWRYQKMRLDTADIRNAEILDKYHQLEEVQKAQASMLHDLRNYLVVLNGEISMGNREAAKRTLRDIIDTVPNVEPKTYTGHGVIDWLLRVKSAEAAEKGVEMFIAGDKVGELALTELEICTLLGNLLDNAVEAAQKAPEKWVDVEIWREKDLLFLNVGNSLAEPPKQNGRYFLTSKQDKMHHGIGLRNVDRVVRKYSGKLNFKVDEERFDAEVILNAKRRQE